MEEFLHILKYVGFVVGYVLVVGVYFLKHFIDKKIANSKWMEEIKFDETLKESIKLAEDSNLANGETKLDFTFAKCKNNILSNKHFKLSDDEIIQKINSEIALTNEVNVDKKSSKQNKISVFKKQD